MKRAELIDVLQRAAANNPDPLASPLSPRKAEELEFHDRERTLTNALPNADYQESIGNRKYYLASRASMDYVHQWIRDHSRGAVVLDYACGEAGSWQQAVKGGAELAVGLDISPVAIDRCHLAAKAYHVEDRTFFFQGDCENTGLPDNFADTVICFGMLHHLDLSYAFPELRRIMKPGGKCICYEALNYNPVIRLYRKLTPSMRTKWESEHILSYADLTFARRFFEVRDVRHWHFLSLAAVPLRKTPLFPAALAIGEALDSVVLRAPLICRLAWIFTFVLEKRNEQ
jgi:SAM-dependent methyltransferase